MSQEQTSLSQEPSKDTLSIFPPLINSSNPWATTYEDLKALYDCPHTGAVTTRTSLWKGFTQHPSTHQYTFFSPIKGHATSPIDFASTGEGRGRPTDGATSSLNTLGYSPIPFEVYVQMVVRMSQEGLLARKSIKPYIVSVTGTAEEVAHCYSHLLRVQRDPDGMYPHAGGGRSHGLGLMMEINLSCPNIVDKPPPAYDGFALSEYIAAIAAVSRGSELGDDSRFKVLVGIKTPPYTYQGQFQTLIAALEASSALNGGCPISFVTTINTLGSCLVLNGENVPALGSASGGGIGGLAGDALHPIALGNVKIIRDMLDASCHAEVNRIAIIGIGGVRDAEGFERMKSVGAKVVGVGTALGTCGIKVFESIASGKEGQMLYLED